MSRKERDSGVRFERECGKLLGVRRRLRANWSESAPDVETSRLVCECKLRSKIAVVRWLEQAEGYATGTGKIAVCFAREKGDRRGPVAILRAVDFLAMLEDSEGGDD